MNASKKTGALGLSIITAFAASPVPAQPADQARPFADPPSLADSAPPGTAGPAALHALSRARRAQPGSQAGREVYYDLSIKYVDGTVYDPTTRTHQKVSLRSYVDSTIDRPAANPRFVAPLIDATPGDTVRMTLHNELPRDPSCFDPNIPIDTPPLFQCHEHAQPWRLGQPGGQQRQRSAVDRSWRQLSVRI